MAEQNTNTGAQQRAPSLADADTIPGAMLALKIVAVKVLGVTGICVGLFVGITLLVTVLIVVLYLTWLGIIHYTAGEHRHWLTPEQLGLLENIYSSVARTTAPLMLLTNAWLVAYVFRTSRQRNREEAANQDIDASPSSPSDP